MLVSNFLSDSCKLVDQIALLGHVPENSCDDLSMAELGMAIHQVKTKLGLTAPWPGKITAAEKAFNAKMAEKTQADTEANGLREAARRERKHEKNLRRQANQAAKAEQNRQMAKGFGAGTKQK